MSRISDNGAEFDAARAAAVMDPALRRTIAARIGPVREPEPVDACAAARLAIFGDAFSIP